MLHEYMQLKVKICVIKDTIDAERVEYSLSNICSFILNDFVCVSEDNM
jgi:hypothetical protein